MKPLSGLKGFIRPDAPRRNRDEDAEPQRADPWLADAAAIQCRRMVIELLERGLTSQAIAEQVGISASAVRHLAQNINRRGIAPEIVAKVKALHATTGAPLRG